MFSRLVSAVSLLAMATVPAAAAPDCPTREGDKILDLLDQAPTCERSLALFQACSYGAGGDVELSEVVIRKCEGISDQARQVATAGLRPAAETVRAQVPESIRLHVPLFRGLLQRQSCQGLFAAFCQGPEIVGRSGAK